MSNDVSSPIAQQQKISSENVVKYYNATQEQYNTFYITEHRGMHFGYWDDTVKSHEQALAKMDEVLAETTEIKKTDLVLDAGCADAGIVSVSFTPIVTFAISADLGTLGVSTFSARLITV